MRAFISGKISGLQLEEARLNFLTIENKLKELGIEDIFNPMKEIPHEFPYSMQMEICLDELRSCDVAVFQNNFKESPGAQRELLEAAKHGVHIRFDHQRDYDDIKRNKSRIRRLEPRMID